MKESKFIELLNLYVDGQLDPADAVSLETEIQRDPTRRRIYGEYCRIQKACTVLAQNYLAEGAPEEKTKVVVMPRQSRSWAPVLYTTGLAAAACVAFLVVTRVNQPMSAPLTAMPQDSTKMATVAMPERSTSPLVSVGTFNAPKAEVGSLVATDLKLSHNFPTQLAASHEAAQFAWINTVKLSPVNTSDDNVFESRALQEENNRTFHTQRPVITPTEITAFQFQK